MRQYKGKRIDNGEWVYGWYMEHPFKDDPADFRPVIVYDERPYEVIPESVGQSTGLKDRNDQLLDWWGGDLISSPNGIIVVIYWNDIGGQWWGRRINARIAEPRPLFPEYTGNSYMKVIGNTTDNPELLEADHE